MFRLNAYAAAIAAMLLLCSPLQRAIADDSPESTASLRADFCGYYELAQKHPIRWEGRELPSKNWSIYIRVSDSQDELKLAQELLYPLDERNPDAVFCDYSSRGYVENGELIPAWHVRNLVWVMQDWAHDELLAGEPQESMYLVQNMRGYNASWPQGMTREAVQRILTKATHLQAGGLHIYTYSDAGDNIELDITEVKLNYHIEAMLAPELPLARSLLREIDVEMDYEDIASFAIRTKPAGLGWLDPQGRTVVLPERLNAKLEAGK